MSEMTVRVTFAELLGAIGAFGSRLPEAIAVSVRASVEAMVRDVVKNRMHDRARYIGVVTGAGVRSVSGSSSVQATPERVTGSFGSPLRYIRAHEVGFHGRVQVRAHTRRLVAPTTRSGKLTIKSTRELKAALRTGSQTTAYVRAHTRLVNIRAKHFFADTLAAGKTGVERRVMAALLHLARTGKVPNITEVSVGGGGA